LTASKNFRLECALSRAPDKAHYLDSCIIQSDRLKGAQNAVNGSWAS